MKKLITIGLIDKRLFLPFISAAFLIISGYIGEYVPKANSSYYIKGFGTSFGFMLARIIPCVLRYQTELSPNKNCNKNNIKDYTLFFVFYGIYRASVLTVHFTEYNTSRISALCSNQSIEIISFLVITALFLKYKYYIHNIISLISFCIFSAIIDLISGNLLKIQSIDLLYIIVIVTEDFFYCYMKYMIDKKYHKYWDIIFFQGVYNFIYMSIAVIIRIKIDDDASFIAGYFSEDQIGPVSAIFYFNVFMTGLVQQVLNVLIIYLYSPNHMLIAYVINKIKKILSDKTRTDYYHLFCIIPFVFQILSLLFYLEIFEFNFCNLNVNTKRNIQLREKEEMAPREKTENVIELSDNLIIKYDQLGREKSMVSTNDGRKSD